MAQRELQFLRNSWDSVLMTAEALAGDWGIEPVFGSQGRRTTRDHFADLSVDSRLEDPARNFRVAVFCVVLDTALIQLKSRLEGQSLVTELFSFLFPANLLKMSDEQLAAAAAKLQQVYHLDITPDLCQEIRMFRQEFVRFIEKSATVLDLLDILVGNGLVVSLPQLSATFLIFLTLPVTVATAERSFSKLKLIKDYLRSTMNQERLDGLALLSIENKEARCIDIDQLVNEFASVKSRKQIFC